VIPALLARRRLALVLIALLTVALGWRALTLRIDPGVQSMIPTGRGDLEALRTFHARFGSDEVVVIALHSDRLSSRESLERIEVAAPGRDHGLHPGIDSQRERLPSQDHGQQRDQRQHQSASSQQRRNHPVYSGTATRSM